MMCLIANIDTNTVLLNLYFTSHKMCSIKNLYIHRLGSRGGDDRSVAPLECVAFFVPLSL